MSAGLDIRRQSGKWVSASRKGSESGEVVLLSTPEACRWRNPESGHCRPLAYQQNHSYSSSPKEPGTPLNSPAALGRWRNSRDEAQNRRVNEWRGGVGTGTLHAAYPNPWRSSFLTATQPTFPFHDSLLVPHPPHSPVVPRISPIGPPKLCLCKE